MVIPQTALLTTAVEMVLLAWIKLAPLFTVSIPANEKSVAGWTAGVLAMVRPKNDKVPELAISQAVPVKVIVPVLGLRVTPVLTVSVPAIE